MRDGLVMMVKCISNMDMTLNQWCIDRGYRDVDDAYADDVIYWTEWEDDDYFDEQL
jgi:hypothetical protein